MLLSKHFDNILKDYAKIDDNGNYDTYPDNLKSDLEAKIFHILKDMEEFLPVEEYYRISINDGIDESKGFSICIWDERFCDDSFGKGIYILYSFSPKGSKFRLSIQQGNKFPSLDKRIEIGNIFRKLGGAQLKGFGGKKNYISDYEDALISRKYSSDTNGNLLVADLKKVYLTYNKYCSWYSNRIKQEEQQSGTEDNMSEDNVNLKYSSFNDYLRKNGYFFSKNVIENYLLSLKVKPFIILTGNSGTGKTKLSQLFAKFLAENYYGIDEYISTEVKVGKSDNSGGWSISRNDIQELIPIFDIEKEKQEIIVDGIPSDSAKFNINARIFYGNEDIRNHLSELRKSDANQKVKLKIKVRSIDNSGYIIVPVGASWTDNTNIIGYYNVVTENYQSTPAYNLIKQAQRDLNNPYFLILDEMNLSHVERYFADFLSAIESNEEIPLYGNDETLKLPDNLFIIGTVNVDETTYMFSPKVLDRANTIEFDTISAQDYMSLIDNFDDFKGDIDYLQSPLKDSNISQLNIEDLKDIFSEITYGENKLWNILASELTEFQEILKVSGFDFGFRVINEILRFMVVAWRYENSPGEWNNWERYFDAQIKQKILPKLHGSEKAIGNVLTNLFNICLKDKNNNENPKNFEVTKDNAKYFTSALKLQTMAKVLSDQRYVSFIN